MKVNRLLISSILLLAVIFLSGCNLPFLVAPTATPMPTYTPYPTYTPMPTATEAPTATELPTATATLEPTATAIPTEKPTQKPYVAPTKTPGAVLQPTTDNSGVTNGGSTPVTWKNETSHIVKIVASGAGNYTITLQAQEEKQVNWNAGDYTIKYYLDGSSTVAGTDSITVVSEQHNLYTLNFR